MIIKSQRTVITNLNFHIFHQCTQTHLGNPDFKWRPSTFWLIRYFNIPFCSIPTRAICVFDGAASSKLILNCGFIPLVSNVQTPFGPLKSGIPDDVLIPAPVCTTKCFASLTIATNSDILLLKISGESNS